jgi:hypothetical protein
MILEYLPCLSRRLMRVLPVTIGLVCCSAAARAEVTISDKPTKAMNCADQVCTPTEASANLNVIDLANLLAAGDLKVVSDSAAADIRFAAPLSWTSTSRLTVDSYHSITFQKPVTVSGAGALTIVTNDGGTGGDFSFGQKGNVAFWDLTSSLTINRKTYVLVRNIKHLSQDIAQQPSGHYALANNYNAAKDGVYSQSPIATSFTGNFEGLGNTIRRLQISAAGSDQSIGLFAFVGSGGVLRDLNLVNAKVTTSGVSFVGVLAGQTSGSTIENVFANGSIDAGCCIAGEYGLLIGSSSNDTITHASSSGSISGSNGVGGLIGEAFETALSWSHSTADVTSSGAYVGGLVGNTYTSTGKGFVDHTFATGTIVEMGGLVAGGLIGGSVVPVRNSFATGAVRDTDGSRIGGLIGEAGGFSTVSNSYAMGTVTGGANSKTGGLIGNGGPGAKASYSAGDVSAGGGSSVGGFIGSYDSIVGTYKADCWDLDTSGISDPAQGAGNLPNAPGLTGLTDAELKSSLPKGFSPKIWGQSPKINNGYPYLLANPPPK